jgi:hypothetical protein
MNTDERTQVDVVVQQTQDRVPLAQCRCARQGFHFRGIEVRDIAEVNKELASAPVIITWTRWL